MKSFDFEVVLKNGLVESVINFPAKIGDEIQIENPLNKKLTGFYVSKIPVKNITNFAVAIKGEKVYFTGSILKEETKDEQINFLHQEIVALHTELALLKSSQQSNQFPSNPMLPLPPSPWVNPTFPGIPTTWIMTCNSDQTEWECNCGRNSKTKYFVACQNKGCPHTVLRRE